MAGLPARDLSLQALIGLSTPAFLRTMPRIRLVTFDVLHTLIVPRRPIHVQYSEVFHPYLGPLEPDAIKTSFKSGKSIMRLGNWDCLTRGTRP